MQIPPNSPRSPAFNFASFIKFSLTFVLLAGNIFTANRLQVQWSSGDVVLKDLSGEKLDPGQVDINQDGDLVQLGYFTDSSPENLFNGEWNVLTSNTRIGDSSTLSNQSAGLFQFSTLFEVGTNTVEVFPDWPGGYVTSSEIVIEQGNPLFGKLIAVRFFDGPAIEDGIRYNTVAHPEWKWGAPGNPVPFPIIFELTSSDSDMQYQDLDQPATASILANSLKTDAEVFQVSGSIVGNGTVLGFGKYESGTSAMLSALPDIGFEFVGWTGAISGDASDQVLSVDGDAIVTATFTRKKYQISAIINPAESGAVSGIGEYEFESTIALEAIPAEGYRFVRWDGVTEGEYDNPLFINVSSALEFKAIFEEAQYSVTTIQSPSEGGFVSGGGIFTHGQEASLQAIPAEGFLFLRWEGGNFADPFASSTNFTVTEDLVVTAVFGLASEANVQITLVANPETGGTVSGGGEFSRGSEILLTAVPAEGYYFEKWVDVNGVESYSASHSVIANETQSFTAQFSYYSYRVEVLGDSRFEDGFPTGSGSFLINQTATISATPSEGYSFDSWIVGGNVDYEVLVGGRIDGKGAGFLINSQERPVLRLYRGVTYRFFLDGDTSLGHPFYFSTSPSKQVEDDYNGEYLDGVSGSRNISGSVEITVNENTPETLYYHSGSESDVGGRLAILESTNILPTPYANPTSFPVEGDIAIQATYFEGSSEHVLKLSVSPEGSGEVSQAGTYTHGTEVQILATPGLGYRFTGWSGGAVSDASSAATFITLGSDESLTANFELNQITIDEGQIGWIYSSWLGFYKRDAEGWLFSLSHGWIFPVGDTDASVFFYSREGYWYWTSSTLYPHIYSIEQGWLYYSAEASSPIDSYFFDYTTNDWVIYEPMSFNPR